MAHELTHGLGFHTSFTTYKQEAEPKQEIMAPYIRSDRFYPFSAYDNLLLGTEEIQRTIARARRNNSIWLNYPLIEAGKQLLKLVRESPEIKIKDGSTYKLEPKKYASHLSMSYKWRADSLMVPKSETGFRKMKIPYGPVTLGILESMGYASKSNPEVLELIDLQL